MKTKKGLALFAALAMMISACTAALPASNSNDDAVEVLDNSNTNESSDVEILGVIEAVGDDAITIDGQEILISSDMIASLGLLVGDTVKVKVESGDDGAIKAIEVELISLGNENANDNANANTNANSNDSALNQNGNDNTNTAITSNTNTNTNANTNDDDNGDDD